MWSWVSVDNRPGGRPSDFRLRYGATTTVTATVITIVDKTRKTSSLTTQWPKDYTPWPTNAAGTRVETVTYARDGKDKTATVYVGSLFNPNSISRRSHKDGRT